MVPSSSVDTLDICNKDTSEQMAIDTFMNYILSLLVKLKMVSFYSLYNSKTCNASDFYHHREPHKSGTNHASWNCVCTQISNYSISLEHIGLYRDENDDGKLQWHEEIHARLSWNKQYIQIQRNVLLYVKSLPFDHTSVLSQLKPLFSTTHTNMRPAPFTLSSSYLKEIFILCSFWSKLRILKEYLNLKGLKGSQRVPMGLKGSYTLLQDNHSIFHWNLWLLLQSIICFLVW